MVDFVNVAAQPFVLDSDINEINHQKRGVKVRLGSSGTDWLDKRGWGSQLYGNCANCFARLTPEQRRPIGAY